MIGDNTMFPDFDQWAERNKSRFDRKQSKMKWDPIINNYFRGFEVESELMENISVWLELMILYEDIHHSSLNGTIRPTRDRGMAQKSLDRISENIKKIPGKRIGIVRKVYNQNLRMIEYELEDGTYIPIDENKFPVPKIDLSVFPDSFLKLFHKSEYRDKQIEKIES